MTAPYRLPEPDVFHYGTTAAAATADPEPAAVPLWPRAMLRRAIFEGLRAAAQRSGMRWPDYGDVTGSGAGPEAALLDAVTEVALCWLAPPQGAERCHDTFVQPNDWPTPWAGP
jgi:hypothetical protein